MRFIIMFILFALLFASSVQAATPQNYLFTDSDQLENIRPLLQRDDIQGVQIVYSWKQLEKAKGQYDFSAIEKDLAFTNKLHKKLFIQLQDRFFEPQHKNIPSYLQQEPQYLGGLMEQTDNPGEGKPEGSGWVAMQWNPALRQQYQQLLAALAKSFDGRIAGINLPETSIDIDEKQAAKRGFTCERYFAATQENMLFAKSVFKKSYVVQYVNFWPCEWNNDHGYMSRLFETAQANNIGLGGPDIVPYKKGQMKNAYPFFHQYKGKLNLVAMAVQQPTLTYTNPKTHKKFTEQEFIQFAENYLGVNIIFWTTAAPWLRQ
jgi:hypothetical protein